MADQFDRFTQKARRALTLAQAEAQRLNHNYIGLEHLLLGLVLEEKGGAAVILQALNVDLALVRERVEQVIESGQWAVREELHLTESMKRVIELAVDEARSFNYQYIGTEHLLLGLLREGSGVANKVLKEMGVTLNAVRAQMHLFPKESTSPPISATNLFPPLTPDTYQGPTRRIAISPIFGLIVLITMIAGYLTYRREFNPGLTVFTFVTGGWIISLCLHEFGHALVAFWGGDKSVVDKGYLTLNPLKYTHGVLSIVLPLIYLALGGIGLPGGAVYINPGAIRSKGLRSLTSAAGPIATAICTLVLIVPFISGWANSDLFNHFEFWAGLAFLTSLQITALFFNLLPIPGLDGFGIIAPYLPDRLLSRIYGFGPYTLILIFVLFANPTFSGGFWAGIRFIMALTHLNPVLVFEGLRLFQFWTT